MLNAAEIFNKLKSFWDETGSVKGNICWPNTLPENKEAAVMASDDLLRGYPEDKLEGAIVVDLGCGQGRLIPYIAPRVAAYIGFDASPSCLVFAQDVADSFSNVKLYALTKYDSDAFKLALAGADLVLSWTVFQHCPATLEKAIVKTLSDNMRRGARANIQIDWPPLESDVKREIRWRWDQMSDDDFGCRWWPEWMTWQILTETGFDIVEMPSHDWQCWRMVKR